MEAGCVGPMRYANGPHPQIVVSPPTPKRLDGKMTKRVLAERGLRAATSLGLTLDADISSDDKEVTPGPSSA